MGNIFSSGRVILKFRKSLLHKGSQSRSHEILRQRVASPFRSALTCSDRYSIIVAFPTPLLSPKKRETNRREAIRRQLYTMQVERGSGRGSVSRTLPLIHSPMENKSFRCN